MTIAALTSTLFCWPSCSSQNAHLKLQFLASLAFGVIIGSQYMTCNTSQENSQHGKDKWKSQCATLSQLLNSQQDSYLNILVTNKLKHQQSGFQFLKLFKELKKFAPTAFKILNLFICVLGNASKNVQLS